MMKESFTSSKIIVALLLLSALALPLLLPVSIICWITIGIIRLANKQERILMITSFKQNRILQFLPAIYLLYVIGLIWTENFKYAGLDLQIKAGFLLLPLFIGTLDLSLKEFRKTTLFFIIGCALACLVLLANAFISFIETGNHTSFFYISYSSLLMHPTYISMYLNMAILFLLQKMFDTKKEQHLKYYSAGILFFFVQLFQLSARTSLAVAMLTFLLAACYYLRKGEILRIKKWHFISILLFSTLSYFALQGFNNRFNQVSNAITSTPADQIQPEYNSTTGRMEIWRESMEILQDNWLLGTGTGDVKDELMKTYEKHQFHYALDKKLNAHNQFLQVWLTLGIVGLLLLIWSLALPIYRLKSQGQPLFALFAMVIILNSMTESILEVQKGVLFFVFFYSLLVAGKEIHTTKELH
ncbi:MAG: O-antigen ligase family protein [Bacteroidetes bacterium]|nr:O-antigen ligase family protein [Bacteroidota bacterium]